MHKIFVTAILGATLAAAQTPTQTTPAQPTAAELLQKGIYAQETAGDLDAAIKIYRQIADSHPTQREIGAQAQYRLGLTLLAKGDAAGASQEIQRLGWDYPDYKDLIAAAKAASGTEPQFITHRGVPGSLEEHQFKIELDRKTAETAAALGLAKLVAQQHDVEFDFTKYVTMRGKVLNVVLSNPYSWLFVNYNGNVDTPMRVSLASRDTLFQGGWTYQAVKAGDEVVFTGAPALDGSATMQATSVSVNGSVIFTRSATATK